jgi:regulator of cell morphogenesis and NO signaling
MLLHKVIINKESFINDIIQQDHRTVDVFRKYGIEYCCSGRFPLEMICLNKGLDFEQVKKELEAATRVVQLPNTLAYDTWSIDFLTSYITNIHHQFLRATLPGTAQIVRHFADEHVKKYPYMQEVAGLFEVLKKELLPHIQHEEETIFPYICQVVHAWENNDIYGRLLVKTLRKPLNLMMHQEEDVLSAQMLKIRQHANNYQVPEKACVSHQVALARLKELDSDLMQHIYLENEILFPRAIKIEQELLK